MPGCRHTDPPPTKVGRRTVLGPGHRGGLAGGIKGGWEPRTDLKVGGLHPGSTQGPQNPRISAPLSSMVRSEGLPLCSELPRMTKGVRASRMGVSLSEG